MEILGAPDSREADGHAPLRLINVLTPSLPALAKGPVLLDHVVFKGYGRDLIEGVIAILEICNNAYGHFHRSALMGGAESLLLPLPIIIVTALPVFCVGPLPKFHVSHVDTDDSRLGFLWLWTGHMSLPQVLPQVLIYLEVSGGEDMRENFRVQLGNTYHSNKKGADDENYSSSAPLLMAHP